MESFKISPNILESLETPLKKIKLTNPRFIIFDDHDSNTFTQQTMTLVALSAGTRFLRIRTASFVLFETSLFATHKK